MPLERMFICVSSSKQQKEMEEEIYIHINISGEHYFQHQQMLTATQ